MLPDDYSEPEEPKEELPEELLPGGIGKVITINEEA